jgi:integrase
MTAGGIEDGRLLRSVSKSGKINRDTLSDWAGLVVSVVEQSSKQVGIEHFGAHDLRRTCVKLSRKIGADLEQIKFCWGTRPSRRQSGIWGPMRRSSLR